MNALKNSHKKEMILGVFILLVITVIVLATKVVYKTRESIYIVKIVNYNSSDIK